MNSRKLEYFLAAAKELILLFLEKDIREKTDVG